MANEVEIRPFIKGSFHKIINENKDQPLIMTFWSENCAFCMKELAVFGKLLSKKQKVKLISITTDPFLDTDKIQKILSSKNLSQAEKWVFADDFVARLYFDVERSWTGNIPLTLLINQDNKISKHFGIIKERELESWLETQTAKFANNNHSH